MTDVDRGQPSPIVNGRGGAHAVRAIVSIAAALFFLQITVVAPSDIGAALGFASRDLGHRWWTIATFTFVHASFWPLALNLTAIGVFGGALERMWGTTEFVRYYVLCALGAWLAHVTFVPGDTVLAGAAAPAIGITLAFAAQARDAKHFKVGSIAMSAGWLAALSTFGILAAGVTAAPPASAAAYLAHAGGLVAGWAYLRTASSINLGRYRDSVSPVPDEPDEMPRAIPRGQPKTQRGEDDIVTRSNAAVAQEAASRRTVASPVAEVREANPLNQLLDKISAHGIESLTADERKLLDDVSRRLRDH